MLFSIQHSALVDLMFGYVCPRVLTGIDTQECVCVYQFEFNVFLFSSDRK
jgi:hypothetical protein